MKAFWGGFFGGLIGVALVEVVLLEFELWKRGDA